MKFNWDDKEYKKFRKLLATFVAIQDHNIYSYKKDEERQDEDQRGSNLILDERKKRISGIGYSGGKIQRYIRDCCIYKEGYIFISADPKKSNIGYLHFSGTAINIQIESSEKNKPQADKLYICNNESNKRIKTYNIKDLGLFDDNNEFHDNLEITESLKECLDTYYEEYKNSYMKEKVEVLKEKKNIILQGAPGTGKTYMVDEIISLLCEEDPKEHKEIIEWRDKNIFKIECTENNKYRYSGNIAFCTFHQSMEYEDFIEGIKPIITNGQVEYRVEPGIFWHLAKAANEVNEEYKIDSCGKTLKPYILVIDEINRGNISKIFGELITLLEAGKRKGEAQPISVKLPYSKESFELPPNLYIIGTMNTTDRSIGNMDYAVRRRFAFITVETNKQVVEVHYRDNDLLKSKAIELFDSINGTNGFIDTHKLDEEMNLEDLKIGHSYFMAKDEEMLKRKVKYEIVPLLKEYAKDGLLMVEEQDEELYKQWQDLSIIDVENTTNPKHLRYVYSVKCSNATEDLIEIADKLCEQINGDTVIEWNNEDNKIKVADFCKSKKGYLTRSMNGVVDAIKEKVKKGEIQFKYVKDPEECEQYYTKWKGLGIIENEEKTDDNG